MAHREFGKGGTRLCPQQPEAKAADIFLRFSHKKTLVLTHFFIEKEHVVSAVTIDNAKIFSQLMSKSRSLGKISKRRLQPLLL